MKKVLIKNAVLDNKNTDLLIVNGGISKIAPCIEDLEAKVFDVRQKAVMPAFYNMHTHSSMTLLRSYCEDLPLFEWLNNIWKREADLTAEDIYNGTRLAILEMIKSGTVFFADMYWHHDAIVKAAESMKIRANVGICFMDSLGKDAINANFDYAKSFQKSEGSLVDLGIAPHAIYTCSKELYRQCFEFANENGFLFHTHLAETQTEVEDSLRDNGLRPVEYLESLGVLNDRTLAAHCVHLSDEEFQILSERKTTLVHNPCSNMKLASGVFDSEKAKHYGCNIALGTDGTSSNNNLSMIDEMKFASLLAKVHYMNPQTGKVSDVIDWATINGAKAVGLNAGKIKEGMLADLLLINLDNERLVPDNDLLSNIVYSADSRCIDSVMCNGEFLMRKGIVEKEEEIIETARDYAKNKK
jgi:5-methylthioadenosine/S-adenosylhomocysteine deaminase